MEEFDQEIGPARAGAKEFTNLTVRVAVKLSSLGESSGPLPGSDIQGPPVLASVGCSRLPHATLLHFRATYGATIGQRLAPYVNPYRAWRLPASKPPGAFFFRVARITV